jgi:hypothetical protein
MTYYYQCAETPNADQDILCFRSPTTFPCLAGSTRYRHFSVSSKPMAAKLATSEPKTGEALLLAAEFPGKTVRVLHVA